MRFCVPIKFSVSLCLSLCIYTYINSAVRFQLLFFQSYNGNYKEQTPHIFEFKKSKARSYILKDKPYPGSSKVFYEEIRQTLVGQNFIVTVAELLDNI